MAATRDSLPHLSTYVVAIDRITDAADAVPLARRRNHLALAAAQDVLIAAVRTAVYEAGVSWQSVGDALGIRRGAAYQRFRRKPVETTGGSPDTWAGV
jgi:hypothetical protein